MVHTETTTALKSEQWSANSGWNPYANTTIKIEKRFLVNNIISTQLITTVFVGRHFCVQGSAQILWRNNLWPFFCCEVYVMKTIILALGGFITRMQKKKFGSGIIIKQNKVVSLALFKCYINKLVKLFPYQTKIVNKSLLIIWSKFSTCMTCWSSYTHIQVSFNYL